MKCFCAGLLFASIIAISFTSCKKEKTKDIAAETSTEHMLPSDFHEFYDRFHTDSIFQMKHITFPLKGDVTDPIINEDEWIMHKAFDAMNGTFARDFRVLGSNLVAEYIYDKSGNFAMERRFGKLTDGWNLIYYDPMSQVNKSDTLQNDSEQN